MILMLTVCLVFAGCTTTRNVLESSPEGLKWELVHHWNLDRSSGPLNSFTLAFKYDGVYTSNWKPIEGSGAYFINRGKRIITICHPSGSHCFEFLYEDRNSYLTLVLIGIKYKDDDRSEYYDQPFGFILKRID